jgi:hypothetical protein
MGLALIAGVAFISKKTIPPSQKIDEIYKSSIRIEKELKELNKSFIPEYKKWWRNWTI